MLVSSPSAIFECEAISGYSTKKLGSRYLCMQWGAYFKINTFSAPMMRFKIGSSRCCSRFGPDMKISMTPMLKKASSGPRKCVDLIVPEQMPSSECLKCSYRDQFGSNTMLPMYVFFTLRKIFHDKI